MKYILILAISILSFSCKTDSKSTQEKVTPKKEVQHTAELVKSEFNITGMTCQIGCANTIQSKLSKLNGVKEIAVSFNDSIGKIEYDKNLISFATIEKTVNNIAGGSLYKVINNKEVK